LTTLDADVKRLVARGGAETTISIHSTDYWPLPWYFRDYKVVGYPPQQIAKATASLLILSSAQIKEAERVLGARYVESGRYNLRPGVEIVLFVKRELAA
jgi:predicted membrane-bound mannosyltransferase